MTEDAWKIKEIIVVEGKDDTAKIKQAVEADTIETNGSAVNQATLIQIRHAQAKRGVIIFTDPDFPGERIRHIVDQAVPGCKHAFLTKEEAKAKHNKGIGIEHASSAVIRQALENVYERKMHYESGITKEDLLEYGLLAGPKAKARRDSVGKELKIGYTNGKQLLKRLSMFEITRSDFEHAVEKVLQEEKND